MQRTTFFLGLAILLGMAIFSACQRNAPPKPIPLPTNPQRGDTLEHIAQTTRLGLSPTLSQTTVATPSPTITLTPTPTTTPTPTVTPTPTPIPSDRLAAAQQAFAWGDYPRARDEFAALLADSGTDEMERQLAAYWVGRSALEAGDYETALSALQAFIQTYPADPQVVLTHLLIARAYEGLGDWEGTITAYQAYLDTGEDTLAIYAHEAIGNAAMLALNYDRAAQAYTDGLRVAPDNSWDVHMREGIAQAELARGDWEAAVEQYDAILSVARIRAYRARILYMAGQALVMADDLEAAYERYAQAVNRYPEAYNSYLALVELVNAGVPVDDYQRGLVDYHAGAYQPAIEAFTRYLEANPQTRKEDAHWYLALSLKGNGNLWQAIQQFQELIKTYPQNEHVAEAWLEMAEAHAWRDDVDQALETYRAFADEYPQSPLAVTALWKAATLELTGGDLETAAASFRDLAVRYPDTEDAPEALFKAALLDYRRADFQAARDGWQALIQDYPDSQAGLAARFWLGKAWLALDSVDEANTAFEAARQWAPTSYYGLQAAEMLGGTPASAADTDLLFPADPEGDQIEAEAWLASWLPVTGTTSLSALDPAIAQSPAFRRGDALLAVGRRTEALDEFEAVKEVWWDNPLAMYQLALAFRDRGLYRLSIICAERLTWTSPATNRDEVPVFIQRLSYPLYYLELVVSEAQAQEIDPLLLFALIRQESLFEPSITSPANASGLTQVIPATGEWIADQLGWGVLEEKDLLLPYVNIHLGAWYLSVQLITFDGEIIPAMAAYNAGPGHIHNWLAEASDLDLFAETMPFAEPRRYVRHTYENYARYRQLYRPES
jgi:soluble lytic murein transglycosylase